MTSCNVEADETHIREREFHDLWAESTAPSDVLVDESFTSPTCPENRFILNSLGNLSGKRVLDLGTGLGEAAVFFAKQGAVVTAIDISPEMLRVAEQVALHHGVQISTQVMSADKLQFPEGSFDIVYGANVLHHVNTSDCLNCAYRVLKPGGLAAFYDPIKYNPVIGVYRLMAHQVRSEDEHPLGLHELKQMKKIFGKVNVRFFWITSLAVFLKLYFIDTIHPNEERYWKKIIYDYESVASTFNFCSRIDRLITRLPFVRWLAWNMAVVLEKRA